MATSLIADCEMRSADPQSAIRYLKCRLELLVGRDGLRHRRSPECWDAGLLHVHEQTAGAATRRKLTLALFGILPSLFAVLAAHCERQRLQPLFGDLLTALEAVAVGPLLQARQRVG